MSGRGRGSHGDGEYRKMGEHLLGTDDRSRSNYGIYDVSCINCISIQVCRRHVFARITALVLLYLTCEGPSDRRMQTLTKHCLPRARLG